MAAKIIKEIDSYNSKYHFKIGVLFSLFLLIIFFLIKNINNDDFITFVAKFNYIEGVDNNTEVKIAGIKVGNVNNIKISSQGILIHGYIDKKYNIPEDSIVKIKSDGIFGKKALSIEPGFGDHLDKSSQQYIFEQTQDSYSIDMFLRYLIDLNG